MVDAQPLERAMELLFGRSVFPLTGLRGEEEGIRDALQPRGDAKLRIAVGSSGIDVVHAMLEKEVEDLVRLVPRDLAEGRRPEDRPGAFVAGASEWRRGDHRPRVQPGPEAWSCTSGARSRGRLETLPYHAETG